jgi:hypothetical protein
MASIGTVTTDGRRSASRVVIVLTSLHSLITRFAQTLGGLAAAALRPPSSAAVSFSLEIGAATALNRRRKYFGRTTAEEASLAFERSVHVVRHQQRIPVHGCGVS